MNEFAGVKSISFDVDGTLWDFESIMRRSLGQVRKELALHDKQAAGLLDVERMVEIRERVHDELRYEVPNLNEVRRLSIAQALRDVGRPDDELAGRLFGVYLEHRDTGRALFDDVRPALVRLNERYTLGLLSNGNSYADRLGIGELISFEVFSQDHGGIEKPDPRLFHFAPRASRVCAGRDAPRGRLARIRRRGATVAGVQAVWLNREGLSQEAAPDGVVELRTLAELVDMLAATTTNA